MDNEEYINIEEGLSVGTMKIANKYEIFTEEEVDIINNKIPELDERVGVVETDLEFERKRIDNLAKLEEGSTSGDAELIDGRIGVFGQTYNNLGTSIRSQLSFLLDKFIHGYRVINLHNAKDGYINKWGGLIKNSAYITDPIEIERNETIILYAKGYETNVSMISEVKGDSYVPLVISKNSAIQEYCYTAKDNISVVLSFLDKTSAFAIVYKKNELYYDDGIKELLGVNEFKVDVLDDTYITLDGRIIKGSISSHVTSEVIEVKKGDFIRIDCDSLKDVVSLISKVVGEKYYSLLKADGKKIYEYEFLEDMLIVISASNTWDGRYTLYNKFNDKYLENINKSLTAMGVETKKLDLINDCYINSDGNRIRNSRSGHVMSEAIQLNKGDNLYLECEATSDVVSVISKLDNGVYTPLKISKGELTHRYQATDDCQVVISAFESWDGEYSKYPGIIEEAVIDLNPSFSMFERFGVIGDSYASGEVCLTGYHDYYNVSWPQILGRMTGSKCINFSAGGLSTQSWLTAEKGLPLLTASDPQQLYILALGINDYYQLGEDYLGTEEDMDTKSNSFYGNYATIIEAVKTKSPQGKLIIMTTTGTTRTAEMFNNAIINIANRYQIPYIIQNNDAFFQSDYYLKKMLNGHPVSCVYSAMAKTFKRLIEKCMKENYEYFKDFIG